MPKDKCFPAPCQCCICRGVYCLIFHKGHDHSFDAEVERWNRLEKEIKPGEKLKEVILGKC